MRKTLYDRLSERNFSISEEYKKLWYLFTEERSVGVNSYLDTVANYVDTYYFRELTFRGSATNIWELIRDIKLPASSNNPDDLLLLCELLIGVFPSDKIEKNRRLQDQVSTIFGNISYILEKTGHEIREDKKGNRIIVVKNSAAILAAEIVSDANVAFDLIEYNYYALKGDLEQKKKILASIAVYVEPILKDKEFKESMYKNLVSDAGFVLNCFHIRHNNKTGAKEQEYIKALSNDELEAWYDKAYDLAIAVIITNSCLTVQRELDELKRKYKWKV